MKVLNSKLAKTYTVSYRIQQQIEQMEQLSLQGFAKDFIAGGAAEAYFEKYRKFLSAGGSLAPLDIIRLADVDLETSAPYEKAMSEFEKTLKELEELKKKLGG